MSNRHDSGDVIFAYHCDQFLAREEDTTTVSDEAIYAYLRGLDTASERAEVEDALFASREFCDEVVAIADYLDTVESDETVEEPAERRRGIFSWSPRFALAASMAAVLLIAALSLVVRWRTPGGLPDSMHLVVLPIECEGTPASAAFCAGLAETVTSQVSVFERFNRSFWVVPADAVAKADVSDPNAAGRRFGANLALTGRLRRLHDEFRLSLVLVNLVTPAPTPLRSVEIAGPIADLSMLQVAAARRIGEMLGMHALVQTDGAFDAGDTDVPAAYERYVEGRGHLLRYQETAELDSAVAAFSMAIDADSSYALAHTGLAEAYWRMFRAVGDTEWIAKARAECDRALQLDADLAATHVVLGNISNESGDYDAAVASFSRAVELDSTAAGTYNGLARSYEKLGRLDDAEATYHRAVAVKPDYWGGYSDLGLFYYTQGRFEEAVAQYRRITELTPQNYVAFNNLGAMYYYLERWDDARVAFRASTDIQPNDRAYLNLGTIYYIEGDYETAARLCEQAVSLNDKNYKSWAAVGNAYYWLPDGRARAMDAYRRAIALAEERLAVNPNDARLRATLASYYVVVGDVDTARAYVDASLASSSNSPFVVYFAGYVFEQLGDRERALELMGRAVELGYPIGEIERDPWLVDLRADARYQELLDTRE